MMLKKPNRPFLLIVLFQHMAFAYDVLNFLDHNKSPEPYNYFLWCARGYLCHPWHFKALRGEVKAQSHSGLEVDQRKSIGAHTETLLRKHLLNITISCVFVQHHSPTNSYGYTNNCICRRRLSKDHSLCFKSINISLPFLQTSQHVCNVEIVRFLVLWKVTNSSEKMTCGQFKGSTEPIAK